MRLTQIVLVILVVGTLALAGCAAKRNRRAPPVAVAAVTGTEPERAQAPSKQAPKKAARGARGPQAKAAAVVAAPNPPAGTGMEWSIEGWGLDQAEAEHDAVKRATKFLAEFLQRQQPPLVLVPSEDYVHQRLIRAGAQRHEELDEEIGGVKVKCWAVRLAVRPQDYQDLVRLDREARHKQLRAVRMEWLAKGLAVVLAGLVALLAFIRVGQWATGLWTRRMRVVVACLLVAAVAGLLCLS
jgi:hypothetical protein